MSRPVRMLRMTMSFHRKLSLPLFVLLLFAPALALAYGEGGYYSEGSYYSQGYYQGYYEGYYEGYYQGYYEGAYVFPPTCSISLDSNPVAYGGGTTLSWSSRNAGISFYINNVGYVTSNISGSAWVQPSGDTDYTGTAIGSAGTVTCAASSGSPAGTLNVTPPPPPSTCSMHVGQSIHILADFSAGPGDTLTADDIDSPVGTGLGATTNPDASKTITFTPSSAGTYTFYARAKTGYYSSWATYGQVSVKVCVASSCTPSYTCSGNTVQYTNATCQVSNVATCSSPSFCSTGSSTCLSPTPSFTSFTGAYNGVSFSGTGHLQAVPALLREGDKVTLFWNVSNVDANSCDVHGSDGEDWPGLASSGASGKTSSSITQQTIFTLSCTGLDGSSVNETRVVNVVPIFHEF